MIVDTCAFPLIGRTPSQLLPQPQSVDEWVCRYAARGVGFRSIFRHMCFLYMNDSNIWREVPSHCIGLFRAVTYSRKRAECNKLGVNWMCQHQSHPWSVERNISCSCVNILFIFYCCKNAAHASTPEFVPNNLNISLRTQGTRASYTLIHIYTGNFLFLHMLWPDCPSPNLDLIYSHQDRDLTKQIFQCNNSFPPDRGLRHTYIKSFMPVNRLFVIVGHGELLLSGGGVIRARYSRQATPATVWLDSI